MLFLALLVVSAVAGNVELPVATQGTEQWAGVVAKAMTVDGRSQSESLQALESFQALVTQKMGTTVSTPCTLYHCFCIPVGAGAQRAVLHA